MAKPTGNRPKPSLPPLQGNTKRAGVRATRGPVKHTSMPAPKMKANSRDTSKRTGR